MGARQAVARAAAWRRTLRRSAKAKESKVASEQHHVQGKVQHAGRQSEDGYEYSKAHIAANDVRMANSSKSDYLIGRIDCKNVR